MVLLLAQGSRNTSLGSHGTFAGRADRGEFPHKMIEVLEMPEGHTLTRAAFLLTSRIFQRGRRAAKEQEHLLAIANRPKLTRRPSANRGFFAAMARSKSGGTNSHVGCC